MNLSPLPLAIALLTCTLATPAADLGAALHGTIETRDGTRLSGEIGFAKDLLTLREEGGQIHQIPVAELQLTHFSDKSTSAPKTPEPPHNGLRGRYYSNINLKDAVIERIDPVISFDWGEAAPAKGVDPNGFSIRWEGEVEVPVAGEITFEVESDDGCRLWVDGKKLIDHWQAQNTTTHSGTIVAEAKKRYPITLEYYDGWSLAVARLRWMADGLPRNIIPTQNLFPLPIIGGDGAKQLHEVCLKSGSALAGKILHADHKRVRLETADGEISIPTPAVAELRLSQAWGNELAGQLESRAPGYALLNRDYAEGKFKEFGDGILKMESVLFGQQTIQQGELRAIKLADQTAPTPRFRLLTRSDTAILADEITTLPSGKLKIRDSSGYHITVPASHIQQLRGRRS